MKIRTGFVSNSSSSSFIVRFPRKPKTVKDVIKLLFDADQTVFENPYDYDPKAPRGWPVEKVAQIVFDDMQNQSPIISGKEYVYEFTYSDNEGDLSTAMEHGDLFHNLEHTVESHH